MKSFLFCTSYIDDGNSDLHSVRYKKWIDYYSSMLKELDIEYIFLIDDGSSDTALLKGNVENIAAPELAPARALTGALNMISFSEHLGRSSDKDYPGWWRSFTYSVNIAEKYGFDKIIHIESDFYITSSRLMEFIRSIDKGWHSLYSRFCNFPETAVQVICKDSFAQLRRISEEAKERNYLFDQFAEVVLPITEVHKSFIGDRVGEYDVLKYWSEIALDDCDFDYIGQLPADIKPLSAAEFKEILRQYKKGKTGSFETDLPLLNSILETKRLSVNI